MKKILAISLLICLFSCEEILFEEDISNATLQLLAPANSTSVSSSGDIIFSWQRIDGANAYKVQIAQPDFETPVQIVLDSFVVQDTLGGLTTQLKETLSNGMYEWRVKGLNSAYETDYTTNGFEVVD